MRRLSGAINAPSQRATVLADTRATVWMILSAIAILGSLAYGASLGLVFPRWNLTGSALWLAFSAGFAWCVFLPTLAVVTKRPITACIDVCLVTIACGEIILTFGTASNVLLAQRHILDPAVFNSACVLLSNATMAFVLAWRMFRLGIPAWKTLTLWMVALNGSGALFFYLLRFLLEARS